MKLRLALALLLTLSVGQSEARWGTDSRYNSVIPSAGPSSPFIPVFNNNTATTSGSPTVATTTADVPVGSLIVVNVAVENDPQTLATFSDNATGGSNSYTITQPTGLIANETGTAIAWSVTTNDLPVGSVFTATTSGGGAATYRIKGVVYVSGFNGGLDQSVVLATTTHALTPTPTMTTGTLANANEAVFGFVSGYALGSGLGTITSAPGFTETYSETPPSWSEAGGVITTVNTPVTYAPSWTTSAIYSAVLVTFLPTGSAGCPTATTFLARTSGLSGTETTAYTNLICGMVADGTWTPMDGLYVFATKNTTTAFLNLKSTSFGLTQVSTCTFTADSNIQCNGTSGYLDPGWTASTAGGNATANSITIAGCDLTNGTATGYAIGSNDNASFADFTGIDPYNGTGAGYGVNGGAVTYTNGSTQGSWIASRTTSTTVTLYLNGISVSSYSTAAGTLSSIDMYIAAYNSQGTAKFFSSDKLGYAFFGGGLNSTQVAAVYNRLHTFLTAVGAPAGC